RTTWLGDTPVIVSRDKDGALHAFVNRCSHRGAMIVRSLRGNAERLVCLYHRWCYSNSGELTGLPFRNGLKGEGVMPQDCDMDGRHRHNMNHAYASTDTQEDATAAYAGTAARLDRMQLRDKKLLEFKNEFSDGMNLAAPVFFPNALLIQINNSLATRQIRPQG